MEQGTVATLESVYAIALLMCHRSQICVDMGNKSKVEVFLFLLPASVMQLTWVLQYTLDASCYQSTRGLKLQKCHCPATGLEQQICSYRYVSAASYTLRHLSPQEPMLWMFCKFVIAIVMLVFFFYKEIVGQNVVFVCPTIYSRTQPIHIFR